VVIITVKAGTRKWQAQGTNVNKVLKEIDRIRDKLYYNRHYSGVKEAIAGLNEVKKMFKYYMKTHNYVIKWIAEVEVTPDYTYIWMESPLKEVDLEALIYAFKGNKIRVTETSFKGADFLIKVW